jgi:hypothetical protein
LRGDAGYYQAAGPAAQDQQIAFDSLGHSHLPFPFLCKIGKITTKLTKDTNRVFEKQANGW